MGPDRITSACDSDRPVADGPVGQSFIIDPVGPRRMFSPCELNQTVTVGPVDQPFTTSLVGTHEGEPDCKRTDQISESPVGSTENLDRIKQTESPSRTDLAKSGIVNEPMAQPKTVVDENFQDVSDNIDDRGGRPRTGNDQNIFSDEDSFFFDRPVAGSPTVGDWLDGPSIINGIDVGRMVMREMANDEANFSADNDPGPVKRIARELRRAWARLSMQWPCGLYGLEFG